MDNRFVMCVACDAARCLGKRKAGMFLNTVVKHFRSPTVCDNYIHPLMDQAAGLGAVGYVAECNNKQYNVK